MTGSKYAKQARRANLASSHSDSHAVGPTSPITIATSRAPICPGGDPSGTWAKDASVYAVQKEKENWPFGKHINIKGTPVQFCPNNSPSVCHSQS